MNNQPNTTIIILLQECASFYFWSLAEVPCMHGSAGFCSLVAIFHDLEHPTFANLWQPCHILVLLSTSFSVILFLSHQLLRVVLYWTPFFIHSLHLPQPTQPFLSQRLFQSRYTRHFTNLLIVHFIFQGFPTYHSQHSHFCGLQPPFIFQHLAP